MSLDTAKTVREVALEIPEATRVFERIGIDYCCGGTKSLEEACRVAHLPLDEVITALESARQTSSGRRDERDWRGAPLADLISHINNTHHKYTREEIARLGPLLDKVCSVHGANHPELLLIRETFRGLAGELATHMAKEELILFPYIERLEQGVKERQQVFPPPFGTVQNPVAMMIHEHDSAGEALRILREASSGFEPPADACVSYQTLYRALAALEADLHQHIHLENNILFPRAIELEKQN